MTDDIWRARVEAWRDQRRRTTHANERDWQAFGELKAGIIGRKGERRVAAAIARLDVPALHDVILPVEHGLTQIDHIVRGADRVLVIETKTYRGHITGHPDDEAWVQHLSDGTTSHLLRNPVWQNHRHCRAVECVLAGLGVPVSGYVVSAGVATFADDLAGLVVPLAQVGGLFLGGPDRHTPAGLLNVAWGRLVQTAALHNGRRDEHRASVEAARSAPTA